MMVPTRRKRYQGSEHVVVHCRFEEDLNWTAVKRDSDVFIHALPLD